jgi:hypothetical protein
MIDHDRLFKELLTTFFWEFIELFLPEITAYQKRAKAPDFRHGDVSDSRLEPPR